MRTSPDHSSKPEWGSTVSVVWCSLHGAQCGAYCTVPTAWCSLHGAHGVVFTAWCPWRGAHHTVPTAWCSLHCSLQGAHGVVLTPHCTVLTNHTLIQRSSAQPRPGSSPKILDPGFICSLVYILASSLLRSPLFPR